MRKGWRLYVFGWEYFLTKNDYLDFVLIIPLVFMTSKKTVSQNQEMVNEKLLLLHYVIRYLQLMKCNDIRMEYLLGKWKDEIIKTNCRTMLLLNLVLFCATFIALPGVMKYDLIMQQPVFFILIFCTEKDQWAWKNLQACGSRCVVFFLYVYIYVK